MGGGLLLTVNVQTDN